MRTLKSIFPVILMGATLVGCGESTEPENTDETSETIETEVIETELEPQIIEDLDNAQFKKYWEEKGGVMIDLRTPDELADGSIEGAINIDFNAGDFEIAMDTLDPTVPTFVYCAGGGRSGNARDMLKENGFLEVYNLSDGYGNWEE